MNTGHQAKGDLAVSEIVKADPPQAVTLDRAGKLLCQTPGLEGLAVSATDDKL